MGNARKALQTLRISTTKLGFWITSSHYFWKRKVFKNFWKSSGLHDCASGADCLENMCSCATDFVNSIFEKTEFAVRGLSREHNLQVMKFCKPAAHRQLRVSLNFNSTNRIYSIRLEYPVLLFKMPILAAGLIQRDSPLKQQEWIQF